MWGEICEGRYVEICDEKQGEICEEQEGDQQQPQPPIYSNHAHQCTQHPYILHPYRFVLLGSMVIDNNPKEASARMSLVRLRRASSANSMSNSDALNSPVCGVCVCGVCLCMFVCMWGYMWGYMCVCVYANRLNT